MKKIVLALRALEEDDGSLSGIVRMRGKQGLTAVSGIEGHFQTSSDKREVFFPHSLNDLFFYGDERGFNANYRRPEPAKLANLFAKYGDKYLIQPRDIHMNLQLYASIPLLEMGLAKEQIKLINEVGEEAEQSLPDLLQRLEKVSLDSREYKERYRASFVNLYTEYPADFTNRAVNKGFFFKSKTEKKKGEGQILEIPKPQVWSSPSGGLPDWAKDWMRKHRN